MLVPVSDLPKADIDTAAAPAFLLFEAPVRTPFLRRFLSLCGSVLVHALVVLLLLVISQISRQPSPPSAYKVMIAPYEKKIVWYRFKAKLPNVSPGPIYARVSQPRKKTIRSRQTLVTESHAAAGKQIVWLPKPKIELPRDLEAPNLLALAKIVPVVPPPPKPKLFVPPPPSPPRKLAVAAQRELPTPGPLIPRAEKANPLLPLEAARVPGPPVKLFQPPPAAHARQTGSPAPPVLSDAPPSLAAQDAANLTAAVIGLHPTDRLNVPLPPASRQPEIAAGPNLDGSRDGHDATTPATVVIPGVTARGADASAGGASFASKTAPAPLETTPAQKQAWSEVRATMLAPQRPSSRIIPAALESRWHDRTVYVVSIPMLDDPNFPGDWTIWFAEKNASDPSSTYVVRPPVPTTRAASPAGASTPATTPGRMIKLSAEIREDGQVDSVAIFSGADRRSNLLAVSALQSWRFLPALRNNQPVAIETVVEIPLREVSSASR